MLRRATDRAGALVLVAEDQTAFFQIVRRDFHRDPVARKGLDPVLLHSAGRIGDQLMAIIKVNAETCVGQYFEDQTFELQKLFF